MKMFLFCLGVNCFYYETYIYGFGIQVLFVPGYKT